MLYTEDGASLYCDYAIVSLWSRALEPVDELDCDDVHSERDVPLTKDVMLLLLYKLYPPSNLPVTEFNVEPLLEAARALDIPRLVDEVLPRFSLPSLPLSL